MYRLYAFSQGAWRVFATFTSPYDYVANVQTAAKQKQATGKTDAERAAATAMEQFILGGYVFDKKYGKPLLRALRHFDEVGISNDLHAALEESLDEGAERFAFATADQRVDDRPPYDLPLII